MVMAVVAADLYSVSVVAFANPTKNGGSPAVDPTMRRFTNVFVVLTEVSDAVVDVSPWAIVVSPV